MENIKIYVLTHKKFDYKKSDLYEPLLNGSALLDDDFGYTRDDTGENISQLNPYYAELTGQYWAWKNSDADIIGFCHYRRYFVKNIFLKRLDEDDIESALKDHDIIMPHIRYLDKTNRQEIYESQFNGICQRIEDYDFLREIIEEKSPEYLEAYDEILNGKEIYWFNMYICRKELFDDYCSWIFMLLEEFRKRTDFSKYGDGEKRILGFLSERLINAYIKKHNLRVKENHLHHTESRFPLVTLIEVKYPFLQKLTLKAIKFEEKHRH